MNSICRVVISIVCSSVFLTQPLLFPALLFRLTGFQVPSPVTSTGNVFSLRLTSDFAVSAHGFKLNYEGKARGERLMCGGTGGWIEAPARRGDPGGTD